MFAHTFLFPGSGPSHICWYFCWYWIDIWRIFAWYLFDSLDWDFAWFFADIFVLSLWPILTCNSCLPQYGTRACLDSGKRIWCYRFGFWYWVLNIDYWILTLITLNIKILTRLSISTGVRVSGIWCFSSRYWILQRYTNLNIKILNIAKCQNQSIENINKGFLYNFGAPPSLWKWRIWHLFLLFFFLPLPAYLWQLWRIFICTPMHQLPIHPCHWRSSFDAVLFLRPHSKCVLFLIPSTFNLQKLWWRCHSTLPPSDPLSST